MSASGFAAERAVPTRTARRALGNAGTPTSVISTSRPEQFCRRQAADQMIERQHRMGLAAPEVRLPFDDRVSPLPESRPMAFSSKPRNPSVR